MDIMTSRGETYEKKGKTDLAVDVEVDGLVAVVDKLLVVPERSIDENHGTFRLLPVTNTDTHRLQRSTKLMRVKYPSNKPAGQYYCSTG